MDNNNDWEWAIVGLVVFAVMMVIGFLVYA